MAEDITPAAAPVARSRPRSLDFGMVSDTAPRELVVQCYNVGGGALHGEVAVEGDWLEVGTSGAVTSKNAMFERNRQAIRVVAYPERLAPGAKGVGRVVITAQSGSLEAPISIERTREFANVVVQPTTVRVQAPPGGFGQGKVMFQNAGNGPTHVTLFAPADLQLALKPDSFPLGPGAKQEVTISVDAAVVGEREVETALQWVVEGNPRPPIPLKAVVKKGGLFSGLSGKLRKG